jgi:hypothetical protein
VLRRAVVAIGAAAAVAFLLFRRRAQDRERIDFYFDDGSTVTLEEGSPEAESLLPFAEEALRAARV